MRRDHRAFRPRLDPTMWKAPLILASVLSLALVSGCGDEDQPAEPKAAATSQAGEGPADARDDLPKITISADKTHAVQPEDEITVSVSVEGFRLDESRIGKDNEPGAGHYRVYLNQTGGDDFLAEAAAPSIKITLPSNITDGSHELIVVLYNNDRTPLSPAVDAGVLLIVYRL